MNATRIDCSDFRERRTRLCALSVFLCVLVLGGCGGSGRFVPPPPMPDDRGNIPEPSERGYNITADLFDKQFTTQIEESMDFSRQLRNVAGNRKEAYNVDAFDEVANSSWFTNRNHVRRMSIEEISRGPDMGDGPDTGGTWIITRAKSEGVTPGFHIKDRRGDRYLVKFDPPGYSELATAAEVISTKIFHAAGFHVPENYAVSFDPAILKLGEKVKFTDEKGRKRFMTHDDLDAIMKRIEIQPDGRIRALASKYVPGTPKGPFKYHGLRKDDPNDVVPHQHRRELRGLRVLAAWLNHVDTKSGNSLDVHITENGMSYLRHYLIDFGSTLGSAAHGPMQPKTGHENQIDPHEMLVNIITLGFYVRPYEKLGEVRNPAVGIFESELFSPGGFKFNAPNPSFQSCTARDGFWGAKIVMSFTDEQLEALVGEGRYSDPAAAVYILDVIKERRDKTGRYWYGKVNPLDGFAIEGSGAGRQHLSFRDLAVDGGLEDQAGTRYRYDLRIGGRKVSEEREIGLGARIELPGLDEQREFDNRSKNDPGSDVQWEIRIRTARGNGERWSRSVKVYLSADRTTGAFALLGIERQD